MTPLTYLFKLSFSTGIVADLLKVAKVVPIHKGGIFQATRLISLLSTIDNILEIMMHKRLADVFTKEFCMNVNLDAEITIQLTQHSLGRIILARTSSQYCDLAQP